MLFNLSYYQQQCIYFFPGDNGYVREKPRQGTLSFNGVLDEPLPHSVTLIAHAIFEDTVGVTC